MKETKTDKNKKTLQLVADLIERYEPTVIVVEDYTGKGSRRCRRVIELIKDTSKLPLKKKVKVRSISRDQVRKAFSESGAVNKYEITKVIANRFPELAPRSRGSENLG